METLLPTLRRQALVVAPLALAVLLSACPRAIRREAADVLIPPEQEVELGKQVRAEIMKTEKVLDDPQVQAYVQGLGQRLVQLSGKDVPKGITPTFTVLERDEVNAFAIPGGDIFVLAGLLRAVENEAELVGVLGHELGHVTRRHVAQQLVTQLGIQTVAAVALGEDAGTLAQLGATVAANGYLLKYSRDAEYEADSTGLALMLASDWNPVAMVSFFRELARNSRMPGVLTFLSSHPAPGDRADRLEAEIQKRNAARGNLNPDRLVQIQQRLPQKAAKGQEPPRG